MEAIDLLANINPVCLNRTNGEARTEEIEKVVEIIPRRKFTTPAWQRDAVLVQREMERGSSPLVNIARVCTGQQFGVDGMGND